MTLHPLLTLTSRATDEDLAKINALPNPSLEIFSSESRDEIHALYNHCLQSGFFTDQIQSRVILGNTLYYFTYLKPKGWPLIRIR